jgi:four helix bundle protein
MIMQTVNNLYDKAYVFAIRTVKAYQYLAENKKEYTLSKQFLRSGTSIGANTSEANGAISIADFLSKISIAYKGSLETKYWLSLLKDTNYLDDKIFESMYKEVDELSKIMFSILKTTKRINC